MARINGREWQHAEISFSLSGEFGTVAVTTFKKLQYKDSAKKKPVKNAEGKIIGYTIDAQETSCTISMLRSEWVALKERLAAAYPDLGIGAIALDAAVTYGKTIAVANRKTDKLIGLMFDEDPSDSSDNQEALVVDIPCFVPEIQPAGGPFMRYTRA